MPKRKSDENEVLQDEKQAMEESEATLDSSRNLQDVDEANADAADVERGADADAVMPAEAAAVHVDTESAADAEGKKASKQANKRTTADRIVATKPKRRSARYQKAAASRDGAALELIKAIAQVQATSYSKFDGTIELHARLIVKKKDANESLRGLITLPSGAPKSINAVLLTEQLIDEIATTKRADADLYLATPALMPKVAKVAKILGPQGKMPNPKTGTVTTDPAAALAEIQSGRIEYRADANSIVHAGVGKVSWPAETIAANVNTLVAAIGTVRLRSLHLAATMGPSVTVDLTTLGA